ncbi:MAG: hypothetical protein AVDCRST_MAG64-1473, partial [uncultured Phycisphaerae bacterium]
MPVHSFRRPKWLASFHAPVFNRRGSVAGRGSRGMACQARSCAEPLE